MPRQMLVIGLTPEATAEDCERLRIQIAASYPHLGLVVVSGVTALTVVDLDEAEPEALT